MSFILDALRKSETDRQQRSSAEFAGVPASSQPRQGPPGWLWIVGILLVFNLALLAIVLMRAGDTPDEPVAASVAMPQATAGDDFAARVASARENTPAREQPRAAEQPRPAATSPEPVPVPVARSPRKSTALLPTLTEVQAGGTVTLPELHVDIHVYSDVAADRFVFINMVKHKEGSRLPEGPLVEEITPDGVVLQHNGTSFLLPRD